MDISVNKAAKSYISIKYNEWFSDQVTSQLLSGRDPTQVKVSTKLRDIKPMRDGSWICTIILQIEREMITHGFDSARMMMKVENPFRE